MIRNRERLLPSRQIDFLHLAELAIFILQPK
jgi:hypothetical protein